MTRIVRREKNQTLGIEKQYDNMDNHNENYVHSISNYDKNSEIRRKGSLKMSYISIKT